MNITESIKFNKLQEENETLKKELAELKQQQLYKEDFRQCGGIWYMDEFTPTYELKYNSKYDKLLSKEDKTCI